MRTRVSLVLCGVLLTLTGLSGCARSDGKGELAVDAQMSLCRGGSCVTIPATGASVEVRRGGEAVRIGNLDTNGRFVTRLDPGAYTARVWIPQLGIVSPTSIEMQVTADGASEIGMVLPNADVTPSDPGPSS